jgi:hypothetical protein
MLHAWLAYNDAFSMHQFFFPFQLFMIPVDFIYYYYDHNKSMRQAARRGASTNERNGAAASRRRRATNSNFARK